MVGRSNYWGPKGELVSMPVRGPLPRQRRVREGQHPPTGPCPAQGFHWEELGSPSGAISNTVSGLSSQSPQLLPALLQTVCRTSKTSPTGTASTLPCCAQDSLSSSPPPRIPFQHTRWQGCAQAGIQRLPWLWWEARAHTLRSNLSARDTTYLRAVLRAPKPVHCQPQSRRLSEKPQE